MRTGGSAIIRLAGLLCLLLSRSAEAQTAVVVPTTTPALAAGATWVDLGHGLAGVSGVPRLQGSGTLQPFSSGSLDLSDAAPLAYSALFVSLSSSPVPFKGGTLVTFPPNLQFTLFTDAFGLLTIGSASWPDFFPSTLEIFFQVAILDAAAPQGVALSNALVGTVP